MPLRADLKGVSIYSYQFKDSEWLEFKNSPERSELRMLCCGNRAIPKTSALGTKFFAHYRKGDCASEPESKEHLYLKELIAKAASKTDWVVVTEQAGESKSGEKWIADVYCTKKHSQVALEVQLSRQHIDDFWSRQEKYQHSGVRSAWFVSKKIDKALHHISSKKLPLFVIDEVSVDREPLITNVYAPGEVGWGNLRATPTIEVELDRFVQGLLRGDVKWTEDPFTEDILYVDDACWKCGKSVKFPYGFDVPFGGEHHQVQTVPNCSTILGNIMDEIGNDKLLEHGLATVAAFPDLKGNANKYPYCAVCNHCGAPTSNYYLLMKVKKHNSSSEADKSCSIITSWINGRWVFSFEAAGEGESQHEID